jgi:hypothetical protein
MSSVFSEGFENGTNGATITTTNTTYSVVSGSGTAVFDNSVAVAGAYSAKFTTTSTNTIVLKDVFSGGSTTLRYLRRYFTTNVLPAANAPQTIMRARLSTTTTAQVVLLSTGKLELKDGNTVAATSVNSISLNSWFRVEWSVDGTTNATQSLRIFLGANYNGSTPDETITATYSAGSFDRTEDGIGSGTFSGTLWLDQADDDNATWPGPSSGANTPPTASAGSTQSVASGQLVTLDGSGSSDSGGTIASFSWSQISGTTVTLSNPTAEQPTFTAPTVSGSPGSLIFGLIVTNTDGVQSSQSTVTITVNPPTASAFDEDFENGTAGAAITTSNTTYSIINGGSPIPSFDGSIYVSGALSANLQGNGTNAPVFIQTLVSNATSRYMRRYFRISALSPSGITLIRLHTSGSPGTTIAQVVLTGAGALQIRDGTTTIATTTNKVTLNTWFRVEWYANGTSTNTQTLQIFLLGNYNGGTATETISGAFTSGAFNQVEDGLGTAGLTGTLWIDGVADSTTGYLGPLVSANAAPTADAGTAQTVSPGTVVELDGSGSTDSDGSVVGFIWSQTSGTSVTLSSVMIVQPTFTAPTSGSTMIFSLVAIDNLGAGSNASTVSITDNGPVVAFNESFESGSQGTTITSTNTVYNTITGTATFDDSVAAAGMYSGKMVGTGSTAITLQETLASNQTSRYVRRYFMVTVLPSGAVVNTLIRVRLTATTVAQVVLNTGGTVQIRNANVTVATSATIMPINTWFRLEWYIDGTTTDTQTLRIYTGSLLNSAVTPTETITGAYTQGAFNRVQDGIGTPAYPGTVWIDEAQDQLNNWPGPATGTNQPPIVSAGYSQSVLPNDTIVLDGTGSVDPDGTIASYAWAQTTGTSVVLSSTTVAQPTFTAPASMNGATLVFSLVVTDNDGAVSQVGAITVTVQPSNEFALRGGTWQVLPPNGL